MRKKIYRLVGTLFLGALAFGVAWAALGYWERGEWIAVALASGWAVSFGVAAGLAFLGKLDGR
jgi:hypothetical protein